MTNLTCRPTWGPSGSTEPSLPGEGRPLRVGRHWMLSDETLVLRARAGDHAAFDALVARHGDQLYTMVLGSLGDERTAGDVLCEAVLAAYRDIGSPRARQSPCAWLLLHGLRAVLHRMNLPPGRYSVECHPGADLAVRGGLRRPGGEPPRAPRHADPPAPARR